LLAHLLRCNLIPEAYAASKEIRSQRDIIRFRINLVLTRRFKNKIKSILLREGFVNKKHIWTKKWKDNLMQIDLQIGPYYSIIDEPKFLKLSIENIHKTLTIMTPINIKIIETY
jgi:hypothetical protein